MAELNEADVDAIREIIADIRERLEWLEQTLNVLEDDDNHVVTIDAAKAPNVFRATCNMCAFGKTYAVDSSDGFEEIVMRDHDEFEAAI